MREDKNIRGPIDAKKAEAIACYFSEHIMPELESSREYSMREIMLGLYGGVVATMCQKGLWGDLAKNTLATLELLSARTEEKKAEEDQADKKKRMT